MEESVFIVSDSTIEENLSSNDCGEFLSKPNADFVLVWESNAEKYEISEKRSQIKKEKKRKRRKFEQNLRKAGLIVKQEDIEEDANKTIHFVKITTPTYLLERYAEVLKLRLPTKNLETIEDAKINSANLAISTNIFREEANIWSKTLSRKFMWNQNLLPFDENKTRDIFTRNKKFLFESPTSQMFSPSLRSIVTQYILERNAFCDIIRFTVKNISRGLMLVEQTSIASSPSASARQTAVMNS